MHKGASCFGVLFLDDASFKSVALHSYRRWKVNYLRNFTWGGGKFYLGGGGGGGDLISYNDDILSLVTRKIACVAYVIPAIFF